MVRNVIEYSLIENNLTDSEKAKNKKGKYRIYTEDPTIRELLEKDQETMALIEESRLCSLKIHEFFIEIKNPEISNDTGRVRIYSTCVYNEKAYLKQLNNILPKPEQLFHKMPQTGTKFHLMIRKETDYLTTTQKKI